MESEPSLSLAHLSHPQQLPKGPNTQQTFHAYLKRHSVRIDQAHRRDIVAALSLP